MLVAILLNMNRKASLLLVILTCCNSPNSSISEKQEDSLATTIEPRSQTPTDSSTYIGFIQKFNESDEFYTDLYFKDPYDYRNYEEVAKVADSLIFNDDETSRSRIPPEYAEKFFDLSGIQTIEIFDSTGKKLTTGKFIRVELFDNMITGGFVATYKVDNPQIANPSYCIGNRRWDLDPTQTYAALSDDELNSTITKFLNLDNKQLWGMDHYSVSPSNEIYSVISSDTTAFVVETKNRNNVVLYASDYSEAVNTVVFIPIRINGKPVLLANCAAPETDSDWTNLLTYDGSEYKHASRCRIRY